MADARCTKPLWTRTNWKADFNLLKNEKPAKQLAGFFRYWEIGWDGKRQNFNIQHSTLDIRYSGLMKGMLNTES